MNEHKDHKGSVLVVDDDLELARGIERLLRADGYAVRCANDGASAADILRIDAFDVVLTDIVMPNMDGIQLMRAIQTNNPDTIVVLHTANPDFETAAAAVEYGAHRYLTKPVSSELLISNIRAAMSVHHDAKLKRSALTVAKSQSEIISERVQLEESFLRAVQSLWIAAQPIVRANGTQFGFEALLRTAEPALHTPEKCLAVAEELGCVTALGRVCRDRIAHMADDAPANFAIFVNLHSQELLDEHLFAEDSALSLVADRIVLELTERASLHRMKDAAEKIRKLKALGFRIAVDDLGAGYAGLSSFALIEPQIVKLDKSLVRDVHKERIKRGLVTSITTLCHELEMLVVAEGVEQIEEQEVLLSLGCDLFQGFLIAPPAPIFVAHEESENISRTARDPEGTDVRRENR